MPFLGFLVFGTLIGAVIRLLAADRAGSWSGSVLGGAAGALLSGSVGRAKELRSDHDSGGFGVALVGAFAVVVLYHFLAASRRSRHAAPGRTKERP